MRAEIDSRISFPFQQYSLVETQNLDDLSHALTGEIGPHNFYFRDRPIPYFSRVTCVRLSKTRLFGINFGPALKAVTPPTNAVQLALPLAGSISKCQGQTNYEVGPGQGLFVLPGVEVNVDWGKDCLAALIWVENPKLSALVENAAGMSWASRLQFPNTLDMRRGTGLSIYNLLRTIMLELNDEDSLFSRGILAKSLEDNLLLALLHASTTNPVEEKIWWDGNRSLRIAMDYIEAHLQDDISMVDLVNVTGVSARKLQYDFAHAFGMGPMALIRREKLKCIQKELQDANPGNTSISEIATRWSFFDRGYLTRIYKKEFGETPSDTLRRRTSFS